MKNKISGVLSLGILALLVLTSLVSAVTLTSSSDTLLQAGGSFTLSISGATAGATVSFTSTSVTDADGTVFSLPAIAPLTGPSGTTSSIVYTTTDFEFKFGKKYSVTVTAVDNHATPLDASDDTNATKTLTFVQSSFYEGENQGELTISDLGFDNNDFGDDEDYWYPLDDVEVTFNVENKGDWKIKDIEIEACLWDESEGECVMDEGDMDVDNDNFDLKSGKDLDIKMTFKVDIDKLNEDSKDYTFYIKAIGEIDDSDSAYDGKTTGDSDLQENIEMAIDDEFVILDNIETAETVSCGSEVQITADVWNIGNDDQEKVYVIIYNKALGINEKVAVGDIDSFEDAKLDYTLKIPQNAEEKQYDLTLSVYNEDKDIFENDNDDIAEFFHSIKVEGCEATAGAGLVPLISVSADLASEAKAGQEMIVKVTIANTGAQKALLNIGISGNAGWSSLTNIDKTVLNLEVGQSAEVLIKLKVNKDVSGEKNFDLVITEGDKILSRQVSVVIEEASVFPGITGLFTGENSNFYLWGIGALNVLLVLIIIIVAVRVVRKKE